MGQYYHVITEDKNGKREYFNIQTADWKRCKDEKKEDYGLYHGLKLMEHSWCGNYFTGAFTKMLMDNPRKVCWCGDYAEEEECLALGFTKGEIWDREDSKCWEGYTYLEPTEFNDVKYLVNNSKKVYVDLEEYKRKSTHSAKEWRDWIVYPLSLLTSLGNGRGGGDYYEDYPCGDLVGSWAFDEVYFTNDLPKYYEKLDVYFKEEKDE